MKTLYLSGRLTGEPDIKEVGDEKKVKLAKFTVANNDSDTENGEFFDVCCWERLADFAETYLKKGSKVFLQGGYNNEVYKDKDDRTRVHFQITANKIEFA